MTATLAPGILPALVSRFFSIQDVSADRCPSSALAKPESNTRSNGTIRVIPFRIKRLSPRRSDRPLGARRPFSRHPPLQINHLSLSRLGHGLAEFGRNPAFPKLDYECHHLSPLFLRKGPNLFDYFHGSPRLTLSWIGLPCQATYGCIFRFGISEMLMALCHRSIKRIT